MPNPLVEKKLPDHNKKCGLADWQKKLENDRNW
jgi:hypothetical protein